MQHEVISITNITASNPGAAISSRSCSLIGEIQEQTSHSSVAEELKKKTNNQTKATQNANQDPSARETTAP